MQCSYCGAPRRTVQSRCAVCSAPLRAAAVATVEPPNLPLPGAATEEALVLRDGTPLRDRARGPAAVLQTLDTGERVHVLGRSGKYLRVRTLAGISGYVDTAQLGAAGHAGASPPATQSESARDPRAQPPRPTQSDRADLPFGMVGLEGESIAYIGKFIYDPFNDRAFVVTSRRAIIGGGGAPMPRVVELTDIHSARMREGSNGMAVGERTIVLEVAHIPGETYIAGLRDPERAFASLTGRMRAAGVSASEGGS